MSPRLAVERQAVEQTLERTWLARMRHVRSDGRSYEIVFDVRTVVRGGDRVVRVEQRNVPVLFELAPDHPAVAPIVIAGADDLFNPNINDPRLRPDLPPLPFVCLGTFHPQQRIADWVYATHRLLAFDLLAADHPFNPEAADWARREIGRGRFPTDSRPFFRARPATELDPHPRGGDAPNQVPARSLRLLVGGSAR